MNDLKLEIEKSIEYVKKQRLLRSPNDSVKPYKSPSLSETKNFVVWVTQEALDELGIDFQKKSDDLMIFCDDQDHMELTCSSGSMQDICRVSRRELVDLIKNQSLSWESRDN